MNRPPTKQSQAETNSQKSRSKSHKRYSGKQKNQRPPDKSRFVPSQGHQIRDRCSKCGDSKHVEGFKSPARKFQCKTFNKYEHFTSLCYKKKTSFTQETQGTSVASGSGICTRRFNMQPVKWHDLQQWIILPTKWRYSVLTRLEWRSWEANPQLWNVLEIFLFQMQAKTKFICRLGNSSASLDQAYHWHFPLWKFIIFVISGLYQQISGCPWIVFYDRSTCCKPMQVNLLNMDGLRLWFLVMVHTIPCKPSPVSCSLTMSIIITSSLHYQKSSVFAEKYVQIVKSLFYKAKEEGTDFCKCLVIHHNTHLRDIMKSPMQILQGSNAISDLPMSNAVRKQLGIQPEVVRNNDKHAVLPTHDHHVGQDVMHQDSASKHWHPAVIRSLCPDQEVTRSLQEMVLFTANPIWSEAFYISEQELSII